MDLLHFNSEQIEAFPKLFRTQLINSLSGAKSANLIGTQSQSGQTNLSIVSSCVHLGAHPPLMGMIIRPRSVPRHTFENILETGQWTVNHVSSSFVKKAHQTSARYAKETSEFLAVGLNMEYKENIWAPFVKEARVKMSLQLKQIIPLTINDTELIIGEIKNIYIDKNVIRDDGSINVGAAETVAVTGLDEYWSLEQHSRWSYAKPDRPLESIL